MAKKPTTKEYPRLVEKVYVYGDIKVGVRIDFRQKTISLTDNDEREVEYMEGWRNILDAMKYAITEAETELREYIEQEEQENDKLMRAVHLEAGKNNY